MSLKVPRGWKRMSLGDFCTKVVSRAGSTVYEPLTVSKDLGIIPQSQKFGKRIASANTSRYFVIKKGEFAYDPMLLWTGSINQLNAVNIGIVSPAYYVFSASETVMDKSFLRHFLTQKSMVQIYKVISLGTNVRRKKAKLSDFYQLTFNFPPKHEQRAIVGFIDEYDQMITQSRQAIDAIVKSKRQLLGKLLTLGIQNIPKLKPMPKKWILGRVAENVTQIPADWSLVRLTSVAKLESGHTPSRKKPEYWEDGDIPWISLQDAEGLDSVQIFESNECINQLGIDNSSARLLPKDTVVLQRTANIGLSSRMGRPMCTSQHFANWVCGDKLHPGYLVQVFKHMKREWKRLQAGSVLPDIYMTTFEKLQILLPPLEEQIKIAEIGEAFDYRIEAEMAYLMELKKTKQALAQELLSGRVRLPQSMIDRFKDGPEAITESAA